MDSEAMPMRWPWQTKEDELIGLLDAAVESAATSRREAKRITNAARREAERRLKEHDESRPTD